MGFTSDNIGTWPEIRARTDADRVAIVAGAERMTYGTLAERVARVAGALESAGVRKGDRVAVALKNRPEFIELLFGVARLGAIFVPLNFRLSAPEVAYALGDSGSRLVIAQEDTREAVDGDAGGDPGGRPRRRLRGLARRRGPARRPSRSRPPTRCRSSTRPAPRARPRAP